MKTLTIRRVEPKEAGQMLARLTDERDRTCLVKFFGDGSSVAVEGAKWMLKAAEQSFKAREIRRALLATREQEEVVLEW